MLCILVEIQACKNERISGCLKIFNTISGREKFKKIGVFFTSRFWKKSSKEIYFYNKHLKNNDLYIIMMCTTNIDQFYVKYLYFIPILCPWKKFCKWYIMEYDNL